MHQGLQGVERPVLVLTVLRERHFLQILILCNVIDKYMLNGMEDLEAILDAQEVLSEVFQFSKHHLVTTSEARLLLSLGIKIHRYEPLVHHVVEREGEPADLLVLGHPLRGVLHGVECEVQALSRHLVLLVVLEVRLVHELIHLVQISLHVEGVGSQDDQADPGPHEAECALKKGLLVLIVEVELDLLEVSVVFENLVQHLEAIGELEGRQAAQVSVKVLRMGVTHPQGPLDGL